eukprot:Skav209811  [mRNA]  locus=scaffold5597:50093:52985:- [translate_table: standard]
MATYAKRLWTQRNVGRLLLTLLTLTTCYETFLAGSSEHGLPRVAREQRPCADLPAAGSQLGMDGRESIVGRRNVLLISGLIFGSLCLAEPAAAQPDESIMWNAGAFLAGGLFVMASGIMAPSGGEHAPKGKLNTMLQQTHGAAALYAVTAAGLLELLPLPSEEPRPAAELTGGSGDAKVLQQLLHLLATCEVLDEVEDCGWNWWIQRLVKMDSSGLRYRHSWLSLELLPGGRGHAWVMVNLTGTNPFVLEHGRGVFDYYSDPSNAELASNFNDLMRQLSISDAAAEGDTTAALVADLPIWNDVTGSTDSAPVVVDVGGGVGHQLTSILSGHPRWQGVLFDLPEVLAQLDPVDRMTLRPGSFFGEIPRGDVLLLKWILHDWDDARCHQILEQLRKAMERAERPRLLIVEPLSLCCWRFLQIISGRW